MDARDRRAARTRPARLGAPSAHWATATILVATLACGCGTQPVPSPTPAPSASPAATATPAPTPTPTPAYADTLRVGWSGAPIRDSLGGWDPNQIYLGSAVYGYLYRYDAQFSPVPDLADGPCFVPGADGSVIRCRLIKTTFQDDTPLTADDVAYTLPALRADDVLRRRVAGTGPAASRRSGSSTRGRSTSCSRRSTRPS